MLIRRHSLVFLTAIIFMGCSNSHTIQKVEELSLKGNATIVMKSNDRISVKNTSIKQDSLTATLFPSRQEFHAHASEIDRIIVSRHNGMRYGAALGISAALWVILTQDEWNDEYGSGYAYYWSAIYGGLGGYFGYKIGSFQHGEHEYYFESNELTVGKK